MTINTAIADDLAAIAPTVQLREAWDDPWVEYPELEVIRFSRRTAPAIGEATLLWRFGRIESRTGTVSLVAPLEVDRYFVRIIQLMHSGDSVRWYGVIVVDTEQRAGSQAFGRSGNQTLTAVAFEWLMTRVPVLTSEVKSADDGSRLTINRGLPFNGGRGVETSVAFHSAGNRSASTIDGFYVFDWPGVEWSAAEMVEYLINYNQPTLLATGITWDVSADAVAALASYKPENVETHGRSLYEVLNQIIDRRRGYTWSLTINDVADTCTLQVHTYTPTDVTLPSAGTLPANTATHDWDCDEERECAEVVIVRDSSEQYEDIRVEGSRRGVCMTAKYANNTLTEGWESSERTDYLDAESGAGADIADQRFLSDTARQRAQLEKVYTWHLLALSLAGGEMDGKVLCPELTRSGLDAATPIPFFYQGVVVQERIPIAAQSFEQWPPILAAAPVVGGRYENLAKLAALASAEADKRHAVDVGCDTVPLVDAPGVRLIPTGMPHTFGKGDFDFAHADSSDVYAKIDYSELFVTVFVECDDYCHTLYPTAVPVSRNGAIGTLVISVGHRGRLDKIVDGTVIDVVDGALVTETEAYLRDDRSWMKDLARLAWEYHGARRVSLHVTLRQLTSVVPLGALITDFGTDPETINSVVTELEWSVREQTTSVKTQFGELDVVAIVLPVTPRRTLVDDPSPRFPVA